eukprot:CAMPEP_0114251212 /NCGR_PEP_ID=MMETSP0058-20121206/15150_1 /TAXON_ID=36894 /ORGANISM="Pyramimonas parkeae, CCMP726" /LENGTH=187 /DNA_ID=CAMNT_0001364999 /DNA_START=36 /DNA_END=599 /DNA_ORIENTATION=-
MASFAASCSFGTGNRVVQKPAFSGRVASTPTLRVVAMAQPKKVVQYDQVWKKTYFGTGLFVEDKDPQDGNYLKKIEEKKLLSTVEGLGLLSLAEKNGLTLSKIEKLGLLSTVEKLGLLSLADKALSTEGATIAALALPAFLVAFLAIVVIPDSNTALLVGQYSIAFVFLGLATIFLVVGNVINTINE